MPISSPKDLEDAIEALKNWCKSQDLNPAESVGLAASFLGATIGANKPESIEISIKNVVTTITISAMLYAKFQAAKQ